MALPPTRSKVRRVVKEAVVGQGMAPKVVYILIFRICDRNTLHTKKDFTYMIKDLEMKRLSWMIQVGPI